MIGVVVGGGFRSANLADKEEEDPFGCLKLEGYAVFGALIVGGLLIVLGRLSRSSGQDPVEEVAERFHGNAELPG